MSNVQVGDRVMAVLSVKNGVVNLLGEGTYLGYKVPEAGTGVAVLDNYRDLGIPAVAIKLDNGVEVYGQECWWGDVEACKKRWAGMAYRLVEVSEYRPTVAKTTDDRGGEEIQSL